MSADRASYARHCAGKIVSRGGGAPDNAPTLAVDPGSALEAAAAADVDASAVNGWLRCAAASGTGLAGRPVGLDARSCSDVLPVTRATRRLPATAFAAADSGAMATLRTVAITSGASGAPPGMRKLAPSHTSRPLSASLARS